MARPPSVQWYYKQYLGDNKVLAMDWDARGMHVHLLMLSIQEEPPGTIPADDAAIRRWLSLPIGNVESDQTWRRVKPQLLAAWQPEGERLVSMGMRETFKRKENYAHRYEGTKTVREKYEKESKFSKEEELLSNADLDSEFKNKSFSKEEVVELFDEQQAATFVCMSLGISGVQAKFKILDSVKSHMHLNKCGAKESAETLVSLWHRYEKTPLKFKKGKSKFFEDGEWANPNSWKEREAVSGQAITKGTERINRNREAIAAGVSSYLGGPNARPGGAGDGLQGTNAGRDETLGATPRALSVGRN